MRGVWLAAILTGAVWAQADLGGDFRAKLQPAAVAGEVPAMRLTDPDKTADWPAMSGEWVAYVEWNGEGRDRVVVRKGSRGTGLEDGSWDHYSPAIVALPDGGALAVWSGQVDGNF